MLHLWNICQRLFQEWCQQHEVYGTGIHMFGSQNQTLPLVKAMLNDSTVASGLHNQARSHHSVRPERVRAFGLSAVTWEWLEFMKPGD